MSFRLRSLDQGKNPKNNDQLKFQGIANKYQGVKNFTSVTR